jgi:hypothetical protein
MTELAVTKIRGRSRSIEELVRAICSTQVVKNRLRVSANQGGLVAKEPWIKQASTHSRLLEPSVYAVERSKRLSQEWRIDAMWFGRSRERGRRGV